MTIQYNTYGSSSDDTTVSTKSDSWSPVGSDQGVQWEALVIDGDGDYLVEFSVGRPYVDVSSSTHTGYFAVFLNGDTTTAVAEGTIASAGGHTCRINCSARGVVSLKSADQLEVYWYTSGGTLTINLDTGTNVLSATPIDG